MLELKIFFNLAQWSA